MCICALTEERPIRVLRSLVCAALLVASTAAPTLATDLAGAKQTFSTLCAACHGAGGRGDGPGSAALSTKPKDLTDCAAMKSLDDQTLFTAIKEGGDVVHASKDMPPWKNALEDSEIHDLVALVRGFCPNQ